MKRGERTPRARVKPRNVFAGGFATSTWFAVVRDGCDVRSRTPAGSEKSMLGEASDTDCMFFSFWHTHTHTHTQTRTPKRTRKRAHPHAHPHTHTHTQRRRHIYIYIYIFLYIYIYIYIYGTPPQNPHPQPLSQGRRLLHCFPGLPLGLGLFMLGCCLFMLLSTQVGMRFACDLLACAGLCTARLRRDTGLCRQKRARATLCV